MSKRGRGNKERELSSLLLLLKGERRRIEGGFFLVVVKEGMRYRDLIFVLVVKEKNGTQEYEIYFH